MRPVRGLASRIQASAPMKGVDMNGTIEAASTIRRPGISVRTTAQAMKVPNVVAKNDAQQAMMRVLRIAR